MLNKRNNFISTLISPKAPAVKNLGMALPLLASMCALSFAPLAQAEESLFTEKLVTAKFSVAELEAENGTQNVYDDLNKKAKRACRADRRTLAYLRQTIGECAGDLMDQFIESANIESLRSYHLGLQSGATSNKIVRNDL